VYIHARFCTAWMMQRGRSKNRWPGAADGGFRATDIVATPDAIRIMPTGRSLPMSALSSSQTPGDSAVRIHRGCDFHLYHEYIRQAPVEFRAL